MKPHRRKYIAPILITVLVLVYMVIYFGIIVWVIPGIFLKVTFVIVPAALAGVLIYVCKQRIDEIRSGEEDDLSKY